MSIIDIVSRLAGRPPARYNPYEDHASLPDPRKERTLRQHVDECAKRYRELRGAIQDGVIEQYNQRVLLWIVIALLVANKAIDLSKFLP